MERKWWPRPATARLRLKPKQKHYTCLDVSTQRDLPKTEIPVLNSCCCSSTWKSLQHPSLPVDVIAASGPSWKKSSDNFRCYRSSAWECEEEVNKWYCVLSQTDQQACLEAVQGNLTSNFLTLVTHEIKEIAQFSLHGEPFPEVFLHDRYCGLGMQNEGHSNNGQDPGNLNHSIPSLVWETVASEKNVIGDSLLRSSKVPISHPGFFSRSSLPINRLHSQCHWEAAEPSEPFKLPSAPIPFFVRSVERQLWTLWTEKTVYPS